MKPDEHYEQKEAKEAKPEASPKETHSEPGIHWQTEEYIHYERTVDWYWSLVILAAALVALSVYLNNILFGFIVAIGAFAVALFAHRPPDMVEYAATERGVRVGGRLYPYQSLDAFWIYNPEDHGEQYGNTHNFPKKLFLESNKSLAPLITIPLSDAVSAEDLRYYLLGYLTEKKIEEPFGQKMMQILRF